MIEKINKKLDFIEDMFLKKNILIILCFVSFLKPLSLYYVGPLNSLYNIWMALTGLIICFIYFRRYILKNKISGLQKVIILYILIIFISTLLGTGNISSFLKTYLKWLSISFFTEMLIKENLNGFLNCFSKIIFSYILINFITFLIFPNGIVNMDGMTPVFFLGNDNTTTLTLVLGTLFIIIRSFYFNKKLDFLSILSTILVTFMYIKNWSVTSLISMFILIFFLIFLYKKNIKTSIFNYKNYIILGIILFLLIVIFRVQNNFQDIIEIIFKKSADFTGRTQIWDRTIEFIKQKPILGLGVDEFEIRLNKIGIFHAHCLYLNILLESGILGFISFYNIFISINNKIKNAQKHEIKNMISYAFLIYFVSGLVEVYQDSQLIYIFMVMAYFIEYFFNKNLGGNVMIKENKRKKIMVIISGGLPLPSVKGGAVETLIDMFLDKNEKTKKYDFETYSKYDGLAEKTAKKYKYCTFNYINTNTFTYKIERIIRSVLHKGLKLPVDFVFVHKVLKDIKKKNKDYDLIIVENNASLVNSLAKKFKGKIILHLHNDNLNIKEMDAFETFNNCRRIYTVSDYIKGRVETIEKNKKIITLYNGIDIQKFRKNIDAKKRRSLRKKYGIKDNELVFVFSGRVCEDKGVRELVEAFNLVRRKFSNIKLLIVGGSFFSSKEKTPYIKKLIEIAKKYKDDIIFTGYIDYNEMSTIYNLADIQVVPSMFDDPCPLTVIEGMVMGLPQIVTISGGIPEEVSSKNAILVNRENIVQELEEAMSKLITNEKLRQEMAKESLKRSELFDMNTYNDNFYTLIAEEFKDCSLNKGDYNG